MKQKGKLNLCSTLKRGLNSNSKLSKINHNQLYDPWYHGIMFVITMIIYRAAKVIILTVITMIAMTEFDYSYFVPEL